VGKYEHTSYSHERKETKSRNKERNEKIKNDRKEQGIDNVSADEMR
jgi:hypothetical protein